MSGKPCSGRPRELAQIFIALSVGLAACMVKPSQTGSLPDDWGPLAVSRGIVGNGLATSGGTLRLTDECVFLDNPGLESTLLVWWQGDTHWDAARKVIQHRDGSGAVSDFRSGDHVIVSGGGAEVMHWAAWLSQRDWQAEPDAACETGSVWAVGTIEHR